MNFLEESRREFLGAKARRESKTRDILNACIESGNHDTTKGSFTYVYGTISEVSHCKIRIKVKGYCPNCETYYERKPINSERKSEEYMEMERNLDTFETVERMLRRRITI